MAVYIAMDAAAADDLSPRLVEAASRIEKMTDVLHQAREAIRLTREYVDVYCYIDGPKLLPAIAGWSWFDAVAAIDAALGDVSEWAQT